MLTNCYSVKNVVPFPSFFIRYSRDKKLILVFLQMSYITLALIV